MNRSKDLDLLTRLHFVASKRRHPGQWGERRSTRRGEGIEFSDFRDYTPGDDPRSVDWNLYARLDRPYVRLYEEEEDLDIAVVMDDSASMGWVGNTVARWEAMQQLAVALGGITLLHNDSLYGDLMHKEDGRKEWGPFRGRGYFSSWQKWVGEVKPMEFTRTHSPLGKFSLRAKRPTLIFILTDGYDVEGMRRIVKHFSSHGHEVVVLHLLTSDELAPTMLGDLRLIDTETQERCDVHIDAATLGTYHRKLEAWCRDIRRFSVKYGGRYVLLKADVPLRRLLLEDLRNADVLR